MDDVFGYVESNRQRFLDELCALLRQPSVSTQDRGVRERQERKRQRQEALPARLALDTVVTVGQGQVVLVTYDWEGRRLVAVGSAVE